MSKTIENESQTGYLVMNNSSNINETKINDNNESQKNDNICFASSNQDIEASKSLGISNQNIYNNNSNNNLSNSNEIKYGQILPKEIPSYQSSFEKSKAFSFQSSILANPNQFSEHSEFGSSLAFLKDSEDEGIYKFIMDRIDEGFVPFFVKLSGLKVKFIIAKKDTLFLDVIRGIKRQLNIKDNLGNFYQNNHLIDFFKTVGELNIQILDRNITNYISNEED